MTPEQARMSSPLKRALTASALLFALPLAGAANAQEGFDRPGWDHQHMHHAGPRGEGGMFHDLDLSEAQRDKLFELRHKAAPAMHEAQKKLRAAHEALHTAAIAENYDAARVSKLADELGKAEADMARLRAEGMQQFRSVLTPEQRKQLAERPVRGKMPPPPPASKG